MGTRLRGCDVQFVQFVHFAHFAHVAYTNPARRV
jgi:hypothetical protein